MKKKSSKNTPTMSFDKRGGTEFEGFLNFLQEMNINIDPYAFEKERTTELMERLNEVTDLWVIIAGVLGKQSNIEPLLSEIYNKNKVNYHTAREVEFTGKYVPNNFDIHTELRIQKALGIIAFEKQQGNFTNTERLIKLAYKQQYNYCKTRNRISLGEYFNRELTGKTPRSLDQFNQLRVASIVALFFFLTKQAFITTNERKGDSTDGINTFFESIQTMDLSPQQSEEISENALPKYVEFMAVAFTKSIYKERKELEFADIWDAMYELADGAGHDFARKDDGSLPHLRLTSSFQSLLTFLDIPYHNVQLSVLLTYLERFQALGVNKRYFLEQRISIEHFQIALNETVHTYTKHTLKEIDFIVYFMDTLAMAVLVEDLSYTRNYMLRDGEVESIQQEKAHLEDTTAKDDLILQLQQQVNRKTMENAQLIKQANSNSEVADLRKRVRDLEKQLEVREDNTKELFALREFMFDIGKKEELKTENINYAEALQNENIVFIGGHDNWIMYMKRVLPNALYLNADSNGRDYSRIKQPNTSVFVHTAYNNHGTYYKAVAGLKETDNKLYFINNTNVELILQDMYHKITQK